MKRPITFCRVPLCDLIAAVRAKFTFDMNPPTLFALDGGYIGLESEITFSFDRNFPVFRKDGLAGRPS